MPPSPPSRRRGHHCGHALAAAAILALFGPATGAAITKGRVFIDGNGNGRFDAGERGLSGVRVAAGERLAVSATDGRYRLDAGPDAGPLFVIKPPAHALPTRADGLPDFWRSEGTRRWDIALRDAPLAPPYDVRVFGDPQPKNVVDVDYFERDIVTDEAALPRARLGVSLGDIVHSNLALLPAMVRATAALRTPWLSVSGNHDRDHDALTDEASLESFRRHFGPDTFAWEEPGLAVVVLDNVIHEPGSGVPARYVGGFREAQFRFLETWLPSVPDNVLLVLAIHIPLFDANPDPAVDTFRGADRQRFFDLLEGRRNTLVLSSHTHIQQHRWHGIDAGFGGAAPLHEYNVGAACGAFWTGVKDARGIPDTRMADGTPNGYATLTVQPSGGYALRWRVAGAANDPPFALHAPKVLRRGAWPGFGVYANVWMGDADTRVEYRVGDGEWQPMRRVERGDPGLLAINADDDRAEALRAYDRAPEADTSPHLWRGALPTDLPAGEHAVEVRVFDRWRGELHQRTRYRLVDAEP
ncbi:MAG: calcineurin-like phosphoesterase C-terminal domain-containing protein [Silanimonas sp.]